MKTICFYLQVHVPQRLRRYRFFDMGRSHQYLDDAGNAVAVRKLAQQCYLPMNELLLKLASNGGFKVSVSVPGPAMEQFGEFAPEVLDSFRELAKTGCVEFLGETYAHSLASVMNPEEFAEQVKTHLAMVEKEFGQRPVAFRNTELIYSDKIGEMVAGLGFRTMLAEGARHILGWKSPNFVYVSALEQRLKLLMRNYRLSDDIAFRFAEGGLTADNFAGWLAEAPGDVVNLFMDYETFGGRQSADSGIFDFMKHLPAAVHASGGMEFGTVSEATAWHHPAGGVLSCPHPMSWAEEERDLTPWMGNELQNEALRKLYALREKVVANGSKDVEHVWNFMQNSDHFYGMATKWLAGGNPYDAFINYMNVLSDFTDTLQP